MSEVLPRPRARRKAQSAKVQAGSKRIKTSPDKPAKTKLPRPRQSGRLAESRADTKSLVVTSASSALSPEVRPEAVVLLAEVLARLRDIDLPIVQFVAACPHTVCNRVARDFAMACVARLGRTLLLTPCTSAGDAQRTRRSRLASPKGLSGPSVPGVTPDTAVAGLYHSRLDNNDFNPSTLSRQSARAGVAAFRMIVLASPNPGIAPETLAWASLCHGSLLAVAAGLTRLPVLLASHRQLQHAGGTLLGTVLIDAPRFPGRLRRSVC